MLNNRILAVIDGSYMMYHVLFSAVNHFMQNYNTEALSLIKNPDDVDQNNLPSLLVSNNFKKELKTTFIKRCEFIDFIIQQNFQEIVDSSNGIDFIFSLDDYLSHSFRKKEYPEYKAQRKLVKRAYSVYDIFEYIVNVLFPELNIQNKYGYIPIKIENAEGDDVIATILKNFNDYELKILFSSDRDFCQLNGVSQFDLAGKEIHSTVVSKGIETTLTPDQALLCKILMGDKSDNIPGILPKVGPVTAFKLCENKNKLDEILSTNQIAAKQYLLNKKLIDFNEIPVELKNTIISAVEKKLKEKIAFDNKFNTKNAFYNSDLMEL